MSISYSALPQIVVPSVKSSSNELTNGTFDSNNTSSSSVDSLLAPQRDDDLEFRIQQRLEASRQGMLQLEALRTKHQKLMQEIRICLPHRIDGERSNSDSCTKRKESLIVNPQIEIKLNDLRCDSPVSCCVSHRSSISMDSGCVSLSSDFSNQSPMSCNTCRKFSLDDQRKKTEQNVAIENDENQQLVAMAIKSTTAQCCHGRKCCTNGRKPKSTCFSYPDENTIVVDSLSFSQITPPPIHRKFFTTRRSDSVQAHRPCLATSCIDIRSPISLQKQQQAPTHLPVNQSPMLHAKPISISLSSKIPTSPYMRLRDAQKSLKNSRVIQNGDNQSIFRASRIFVDHSSRIVQCPKHIERYDSDEESPRLLRAQPAVLPSSVICRQQSYAHSNESSPCQLRKVHLTENSNSLSNGVVLECHQQLNRCESSQSSETIVPDRTRRRKKEKDWKESEDL
ncbi:unnamed protein product [Onchocerca ochengi]|uniref:Uncharacterized protein n=1 Tax=Onchocerca ochengi TaxID=42157 RepID=A0A182E5E1_ONCOC|nr:unnamed protein product [Onchocerca ochengi]